MEENVSITPRAIAVRPLSDAIDDGGTELRRFHRPVLAVQGWTPSDIADGLRHGFPQRGAVVRRG
jgi:hypothetical protein